MKSHRSGMLGLALSAMLLGLAACDDKTEVVIPPPPVTPITVSVTPQSLDMQVGQTATFVAQVSGGAEGTARTVNWTSSNSDVASVNASGMVTAVAPGIATITATSTVDASAAAAASVRVEEDPSNAPISISIQSVTTGATNVPVNTQNVFGQIDVTLNVDAPVGANFTVETLIDGIVVCSQSVTAGAADVAASAEEEQAQQEIICSIPTQAFDAETGETTWQNGPHALTARVIRANGEVVATPSTQLIFNNISFVNVSWQSSETPATNTVPSPTSLATAGSLWHSGDITINLLSVNYGAATDNVATATVTLTSSGYGVTGVAGCATTNNSVTDPTVAVNDGGAGPTVDPDGAGPLLPNPALPGCPVITASRTGTGTAGSPTSITFPANALLSAASPGVSNVEEVFSVNVASVTTGGQAGPTCINPDPNFNPQGPFCGVYYANPLRVDNMAPRLIVLDHFRNANNYFGPNSYLVSHTAGLSACPAAPTATPWFGLRRPCIRSVDYGVGGQTAAGNTSLSAVVAADNTTALTANTAGELEGNETATSTAWRLRIMIEDALDNARTVFATATTTTFSTTAAGGTQLWGWDETAPTQSILGTAPGNMSVNTQIPSWTVGYLDSATPPAGPSGFDANPVWARVQRDAASLAAPTCHDPDAPHPLVTGGTGNVTGCTGPTGGFVSDDGLFDNPGFAGGLDGYYTHRFFAVDAAGNESSEMEVWTLNDFTPPSFTGGVVVPAVLTGGSAVSFSSALADAVDLGSLDGYIRYGATNVQFAQKDVIGEFTPESLVGTDVGMLSTTSFIRRLEGNAGGIPDGAPALADAVAYLVRDMAGHAIRYNDLTILVGGTTTPAPWGAAPYVAPNDGLCPASGAADNTATQNCMKREAPIATQAQAGFPGGVIPAGSAFQGLIDAAGLNGLHGQFAMQAPSAATICNNTALVNCATTPATPFTTTLSVTLTGPAATFQSPFADVSFYYQDADGYWQWIATVPAGSVTDNTVLNTRTFTYSASWDARNWKVRPAGPLPGTATTVVAIGRTAAGDALMSTTGVVNVAGN